MLATCRVERREGRHRADAPSAPPKERRHGSAFSVSCYDRFNKALEKARKKSIKAQEKAGKTILDPGVPVCGEHRPPDRTPVR